MASRLVETSDAGPVGGASLRDYSMVKIPKRLLDEMIESLEVGLRRLRCSSDGSVYSRRLVDVMARALAEAIERRGAVKLILVTDTRDTLPHCRSRNRDVTKSSQSKNAALALGVRQRSENTHE